jgi:hypothetical protein
MAHDEGLSGKNVVINPRNMVMNEVIDSGRAEMKKHLSVHR